MSDTFTRVRESMATSRRRGRSFEDAWNDALADVDGADWIRKADAVQDKAVLEATVAVWRAAYGRAELPPRVRAAAQLRGAFG
jgi:hypothetical protein